MESIKNNLGATIIVDYGCEPESIKSSLEAAAQMPHGKLIHVFGSTGGHRDISKRFVFGKTSAQYADEIIITNDDVYDSNPEEIAANIEEGIKSFKLRKPSYQIILDRREAIKKALFIAKAGDLVLLTGKGSEQFLVLPGNKRIEWDEREVVREELTKFDINRNS
jgi:UDP-N-acetylmuramoyl-L-alanyl-D-glutamate--2,6-diaminopimelate ligase